MFLSNVFVCSVSEIDKFKYNDAPAELMTTSFSCTAAYPKGAQARSYLPALLLCTASYAEHCYSRPDLRQLGVCRSVQYEAWPGRVQVWHAQAIAEGAQPV